MFEALIGSFFITLISSIILFLFFRHKVLWWEILILLGVSLIIGASFKGIATSGMTKDVEYWNTIFERVEYYEAWDEEVSCSHSYDCYCGTDEDGYECCCSTCYQHIYDVDDHSERFYKVDNHGNSYEISESEYLRLKEKMGNSTFKDLGRDYHSYDGDMYYTSYNGLEKDFETIVTEHRYENKPQVITNVFQYIEVDSFDLATYKLFEYPEPSGRSRYYQKNILGYEDSRAEHRLQILNGRLGHSKEVKVFVVVFRNQPMQAGNLQENYWKGGNKNEVVITINIDDNGKPTWCMPFSWSEKELFKINIRNFVMEQEKLDLTSVVNYSYKEIESNYERKKFSDFDYLEVKLTTNQMIWLVITSIIVNILLSIFIVMNDWEDGWRNGYGYRGYKHLRGYKKRRY
tara:strand:- start:17570 stop:18778 length:1209 start_codon:yes stop_codon:yes gene_type:complete